jgi:NTE family protein
MSSPVFTAFSIDPAKINYSLGLKDNAGSLTGPESRNKLVVAVCQREFSLLCRRTYPAPRLEVGSGTIDVLEILRTFFMKLVCWRGGMVGISERRMSPSENDASGRSVGQRPAFAIFEGGGAKGICHVGALEALRAQYWLVGAAGASAGAIVAALAAVGYRAEEIFDARAGTDILEKHGTSPTKLIGRVRWLVMSNALGSLPASWAMGVWSAIVIVVVWLRGDLTGWWWLAVMPIVIAAVNLAILAAPIIWTGGVFSTRSMRDALDRILRDRLQALYDSRGIERQIGDYVTFEDMSPLIVEDTCRLRIIVTDAKNGRLVQFDDRTPTASVADAVAASAALPFVFPPSKVRGFPEDDCVFVDGGLVSNLPVWAFGPEKRSLERDLNGEPVPIIAFRLKAVPPGTTMEAGVTHLGGCGAIAVVVVKRLLLLPWQVLWRLPRLLALRSLTLAVKGVARVTGARFNIATHVGSVVEAGIFGSQTVVRDFVSDLRIVEMESPLRTAEFGCSRAMATRAYDSGLRTAFDLLERWGREEVESQALLNAELPEIERSVAGLS